MASRRREATQYNTYGSVAYAPAYEGGAIRLPRREEEQHRRPQPKQREHVRRRELTRTQVQVRQAGQVAPFAVIGFLAVAAFAALLLFSHVQYTVLNGEVASLRSQMTKLQSDNATLSAQYEKVFDPDTIQNTVGDAMVRPTGDQVVYIDLSEPDSVVLYGQEEGQGGLSGAIQSVKTIVGDMIEYFR